MKQKKNYWVVKIIAAVVFISVYFGVHSVSAVMVAIPKSTTPDTPTTVTPQKASGSSVSSVYNLLAPIGSLTKIPTNDIGVYLNLIFNLAIGLCAGLAVIMIVIASIQYMGTESVFGKTEAKSQILSAILGLLIALGSYAILNTISPDLLGSNGVNVDQVTAQIDPETEVTGTTTYNGIGNSKQCTTGYVDVATYTSPSKINVCSSINKIPVADNLKKLLAAAKTDNILLSGSGSRSYATQVSLRNQHGCPDPNTPSSSCRPPTARPGYSNHEVGGAVDFTCNGGNSSLRAGDPCFSWLSKNAGKYGFINFGKEPWHWSFNGK